MENTLDIKSLFLLNQEIIFLNHGSFGSCPVEIMDEYQKWQRIIESQPVEFIGRKHGSLLKEARQCLSKFLNADSNNLVFVTNATTALNFIAWNLDLKPGDEVLTTNLEYGAMDRMWENICEKRGAKYVKVPIVLPIENELDLARQFENYFNERTKVLFISMITSSTGLYLPINELCKQSKSRGVINVIDGAHVPGQLSIDLENSDFDFFTGNCHKWMCAPKGCAFLFANKSIQNLLKPLIISWGNEIDTVNNTDFINDFEYLGTRDISAFLTIEKCIEFLSLHKSFTAKNRIKDLLEYSKEGLQKILKTPSIVNFIHPEMQMYAHLLPDNIDGKKLKQLLYDNYKIEIPVSEQNGKQYIRISIQIYNTKDEIDYFLEKLEYLIGLKQ